MAEIPAVHVCLNPLLSMILAAVDSYNRECFGLVFGVKPTKERPYYVVTRAENAASSVKRKNTGIEMSRRADQRVTQFIGAAVWLYRCIGDFHSHPAFGSHKARIAFSDADTENLASQEYPLSLVVTIARRGKRILPWHLLDRGTRLRGSLGGFEIHVNAYRALSKEEAERLPLMVARSTLRVLNRHKS